MPQGSIKAVTFDLWNTIYSADDGSLDPVRPRRREAMRRLLTSLGVHPTPEQLQQAYSASFNAYLAAWEAGKHYGAKDQVCFFLDWFGIEKESVAPETIDKTAREIEDAGLVANLKLLPGLKETVQELAALGYRLAVISDTSLTPGRVLREFLQKDGILECFAVLSFSDEIGYPKPDQRIFARTLEQLGARPDQAAHVGDTPRTDIAGAKAMGMVAIRCAAALDQTDPPPADYVIYDHRDMLKILEKLS